MRNHMLIELYPHALFSCDNPFRCDYYKNDDCLEICFSYDEFSSDFLHFVDHKLKGKRQETIWLNDKLRKENIDYLYKLLRILRRAIKNDDSCRICVIGKILIIP